MRRRHFMSLAGGIAIAGVAGCTAPRPVRHPFADRTVSVRIDDESETTHDVAEIAGRALEYWEEHSPAYIGFQVRFDRVSSEEPDMIVRFVDRPDDCHQVENYSEYVLGCAPLIRPGARLNRTVRAIVVAGARPIGKITTTTKHELGHTLGLGHDDEPLEIMSNRPELRIPMYERRIELWELVLTAREESSNATVLFDHAVSVWGEQNYEGGQAAFQAANAEYGQAYTRFEAVRERIEAFAADSTVETVDLEGLRGLLDRLVERTRLAEAYAAAMAAASTAAAAGDSTTANEAVSTANNLIREFNALDPVELRDVAIVLGLVRGFDRDEPVVGGEDEIRA